MSRALSILPECYVDTLLVDLVGFKKPNHQTSIGQVANTLKTNYKNRLAIGVVDNDKSQPKYFDEFELLEKKQGLILKKHSSNKHFLIIIDPDFEKWIFEIAELLGVNPADYGFKTVKAFKNRTKDIHVAKNQKVKDFLNRLVQKKDSPAHVLKRWINDILDKKIQ